VGNPVDVDVKNGHEDANSGAGTFEVGRLSHGFHFNYFAVGRRNDHSFAGRHQSIRIPEKETDETGDEKSKNRHEPDAKQRKNSCGKSGCENERIPGLCHWKCSLTWRIRPV
jgi:hypothetical protein